MNLLVTGGCGFIGSNFIEHVINKKRICKLVNVDGLSYAGSLDNTRSFRNDPKYLFEKYDLSDNESEEVTYLRGCDNIFFVGRKNIEYEGRPYCLTVKYQFFVDKKTRVVKFVKEY